MSPGALTSLRSRCILGLVALAVLPLYACDGGEDEVPERTAPEIVVSGDDDDDDGTADIGPGAEYTNGPYTLRTPNALWRNLSFRDRLFFARRSGPEVNDEIAYLEAYSLPVIPESVRRALDAGLRLDNALAQALIELLEEKAPGVEVQETLTGYHGSHPAATVVYRDRRETFLGVETTAHNEVTLVQVPRRCHLIAVYCYADYAETLSGEFSQLVHSLRIEPPPPPPPPQDAGEVEDGEGGESEAETTSEAADDPPVAEGGDAS